MVGKLVDRDVAREGVSQRLIMKSLKLISALLSVHYFILIVRVVLYNEKLGWDN